MGEYLVSNSTGPQILGYKVILVNTHPADAASTNITTSLTGTFDILYHPFADRYLAGTLGQLCSAMDVAPHIVEEAHREITKIQASETDAHVKWVFDPRVYMRDSNFTFCLQKVIDPAVALTSLTDPAHYRLTPLTPHLGTASAPPLDPDLYQAAATVGGCCCGGDIKQGGCRRLSFKTQETIHTDDEMDVSSASDASNHRDVFISRNKYTGETVTRDGEEDRYSAQRTIKKESGSAEADGGTWRSLTRDRKRARIGTDGLVAVKPESHDGSGHDFVEGPFGETAN
ncbi:hypothetical protein Dda_5135 [Drechslerella dactyloides]|uniref:Uncharacterized protein n=1 Tax=Drechslerella dactyloides TaxID=74499 RepID=A0AAD6IVQ1_DREDA|nr:hypothetical protein Dda_5135 [Drechslerella dactyloides]